MLRRLFFNLAYFKIPIWDTGISPPELLDFIATHEPGKALDLGCGTGTNVITLAKAGWQVTGIDFALRAIQKAKKKAKRNGVKVELHVGDVTHLNPTTTLYDLILDIGCFHSLPPEAHERYITGIQRSLAPTGTYLLYTFFKDTDKFGPGVQENAINLITQKLRLINRQDGSERGLRPSAWLAFQL